MALGLTSLTALEHNDVRSGDVDPHVTVPQLGQLVGCIAHVMGRRLR